MDQGFGGTPTDAPYHYHSIYDSERWQELYGDPGFSRHVCPLPLCTGQIVTNGTHRSRLPGTWV